MNAHIDAGDHLNGYASRVDDSPQLKEQGTFARGTPYGSKALLPDAAAESELRVGAEWSHVSH